VALIKIAGLTATIDHWLPVVNDKSKSFPKQIFVLNGSQRGENAMLFDKFILVFCLLGNFSSKIFCQLEFL
jgi:hypothetical protein